MNSLWLGSFNNLNFNLTSFNLAYFYSVTLNKTTWYSYTVYSTHSKLFVSSGSSNLSLLISQSTSSLNNNTNIYLNKWYQKSASSSLEGRRILVSIIYRTEYHFLLVLSHDQLLIIYFLFHLYTVLYSNYAIMWPSDYDFCFE